MLSTYLEHLNRVNNNLKKEGIDLGLDFSENCTHLSEQVTILEQYLYYNHVLRTTNSSKQLTNLLPFEESSLDDFLRKKLYKDYEEEWNAKLEELTKQPEDAGVVDVERQVIDRGTIRAFHEFLNLKTEDEKPSAIPTWSAFTNTGVSDDFDDEDEEDDDDLFYPDDEETDDFSEVSQNPQSENKLSDGRNSALSSIMPTNSSSDMEFDDEDDEYPDFDEEDEYEFDDDEETTSSDDDYPDFDDEYEFDDEEEEFEDDDDYPDFEDDDDEFEDDEDDDYPDFDDGEEEFDEDDDYPDFEDDDDYPDFDDEEDDYPDFEDDDDDYPDFDDEEDEFEDDDDYPDFDDEEDDYPDFEDDDDDYPDFEDEDEEDDYPDFDDEEDDDYPDFEDEEDGDYPDFEDEEDDDYPDFDNYDEDDSDEEPDFDDYDEDDYEDEYSDLNVQSIQPVRSTVNTGVSTPIQPPKQYTPAKETVIADKTVDSVNKLLNKLFR